MQLVFEIKEAPDGSVTVHALRRGRGTRRENISADALVEASKRAGMPPRSPRGAYSLPADSAPELSSLLNLVLAGP